jgi:hypothetical protein
VRNVRYKAPSDRLNASDPHRHRAGSILNYASRGQLQRPFERYRRWSGRSQRVYRAPPGLRLPPGGDNLVPELGSLPEFDQDRHDRRASLLHEPPGIDLKTPW